MLSSSNTQRAITRLARISILAIAAIIALVLSGCMAPPAASNTEDGDKPLTSSEYMAQVNQTVKELDERLQSFNEAVSRQDPITMRTQADSAFAVLDKLAAIEAPEDIKDLRDQYVKGCDQLKEALNSYIDLYSEVSAEKAKASSSRYYDGFDASEYADRLGQIQAQYDEGIKTLEDADSSAKDR